MKKLLQLIGFIPKENTKNTFHKTYKNNYTIEVDFEKESIHYGNKIQSESKTTSNFSQKENWVVLECVNRLLEKGYNPEDIILEKTYKLGHKNKGRLDILVQKEGKTFLMIECKTRGKEYEKELKNMQKNGGQLFTYFQQDREAKYLVLYTANISEQYDYKTDYKNEIVKVESHYKETTSVVDFYERWNKLTKQNGIFEDWISAYRFESRALTKRDLKPIKQEDASIIFNEFLEILRKNTVSDKPNAFNKIFTLFLCKIYDEGDKRDTDELEFQWIEGKDNHIDFQLKLSDLYKKGMDKLLEKEVTDLSNEEFNKKFGGLSEEVRKELLKEINKIRLEKNNEFAIKDVFDAETFEENAIVLKEVVELLQKYQIRYEEKQPFLGDFFELLLTTGLKQESGQFFTPVPLAKFICKSIPIASIIEEKLEDGNHKDLLPAVIDYAAGSGHFLTESMEEIQEILGKIPKNNLKPDVAKKIKSWEGNFDWAYDYMYGIEKDYRLVKTAKVGCFLHGDGIANVIHGDGLDSFEKSKKYRGLLREYTFDDRKENAQFDLVLSNPPYSVSSFKANLKEYAQNDFTLFSQLTESSSEIEALFIERTSQLLKEGGIAGIILPSSILSNAGIYAKAREIILQDFEIIAITELGSHTFMATGTNTVTLFLKKRNKYFAKNLKTHTDRFFTDMRDVTFNGVENAVSKYVHEVRENVSFEEYVNVLQGNISENVEKNDIFREYKSKIKAKTEKEFVEKTIEREKEKLFYFVLSYPQKVVLVQSGEKKVEKAFLGYEFSKRRGSEGIHPIQRGKQIDECTKLFDPHSFDNPKKASTYIYDAFLGNFEREIDEEIKDHIKRVKLVDMLTFDRADCEKNINLNKQEKVRYEELWGTDTLVQLGEIAEIQKGTSITRRNIIKGEIPVVAGGKEPAYFHNVANREGNVITVSASGANAGFINYFENPIFASDCNTITSKDETNISTKLILIFLQSIQKTIYGLQRGQAQPHVYGNDLAMVKIPLPPLEIQEKILAEVEKLDEKFATIRMEIEEYNAEIKDIFENFDIATGGGIYKLGDILIPITGNNTKIPKRDILKKGNIPVITQEENKFISGYSNREDYITDVPLILFGDHSCSFKYIDFNFFRGADGTILLKIKQNIEIKYVYNFLKNSKIENNGKYERHFKYLKNIKIPLPSLETQKQIVGKIETIEEKIQKLQTELENIPQEKENIIKKYL